jgi:hypothetical protein
MIYRLCRHAISLAHIRLVRTELTGGPPRWAKGCVGSAGTHTTLNLRLLEGENS